MAFTPYIPKLKPPFPYDRPLSWSQLSSFKYRPSQWYNKYVLGEEEPPSKEMLFGKTEGERFASDPTYMPQLPRLSTYEHKLRFTFNGLEMLGFVDAYTPHTHLGEYKTGRKAWDKKRVDQHGQLDMYLLGVWTLYKVRPEDVVCHLHWLPTHIKDGEVAYIEPIKVHSFKAKRTMADILRFGQWVMETRKEMEDYYNKQ